MLSELLYTLYNVSMTFLGIGLIGCGVICGLSILFLKIYESKFEKMKKL